MQEKWVYNLKWLINHGELRHSGHYKRDLDIFGYDETVISIPLQKQHEQSASGSGKETK